MASQTRNVAGWDTPNGWVNIVFDDVTGLISTISWHNQVPAPNNANAVITITISGVDHSFTLPDGADNTTDISAYGITMVFVTDAKGSRWQFPSAVTLISTRFPA